MAKSDIGGFYLRASLEEFDSDVLSSEDGGMMVNMERLGLLHASLTEQVVAEMSRYIRHSLIAQLRLALGDEEEDQEVRECVLAAILLRRRIAGSPGDHLVPVGYGPATEEIC